MLPLALPLNLSGRQRQQACSQRSAADIEAAHSRPPGFLQRASMNMFHVCIAQGFDPVELVLRNERIGGQGLARRLASVQPDSQA